MHSIMIHVSQDGMPSLAAADAVPGQAGDGSLVLEIAECPPKAGYEEALEVLAGQRIPAGVYRFTYEKLLARRSGSCCGGSCGG